MTRPDLALAYWLALSLAVVLAAGSMTAAAIYKHRWHVTSARAVGASRLESHHDRRPVVPRLAVPAGDRVRAAGRRRGDRDDREVAVMWAVVVFLAGIVAGACGLALVNALRLELAWWSVRFAASLPPSTPRAIARAARRNRADLRHLLPAREVGVRVTSVRLVDRREYDPPRLGEPPSFLPSVEAFDEEHAR